MLHRSQCVICATSQLVAVSTASPPISGHRNRFTALFIIWLVDPVHEGTAKEREEQPEELPGESEAGNQDELPEQVRGK
jgi:hypothetical protein